MCELVLHGVGSWNVNKFLFPIGSWSSMLKFITFYIEATEISYWYEWWLIFLLTSVVYMNNLITFNTSAIEIMVQHDS